MLKNIVLLIAAIFAVVTYAEPMKMGSKAELSAAKSAADELVKSGVSADEVMKYAEEAKKSAEKYQLYCAAFKLYAKEEKAEEAAKVITTIQAEFIGAPDKDIVSMIEQYGKKLTKDNAELGATLTTSKARVSASQQLSKAKKDLKKNPNSVELKYLIAESHAVLGDWKAALKQFKDAGGSVWQIANEESSGVVSAKTAAFWWDYKPRSKFNAEPAFKAHSAALYEKLLNNGELSVLEKATAEKRIEQASSIGAAKPKSEIDKLKKICDTKGLVHCWRFNGDLKDCVGGCKSSTLHNEDILDDEKIVVKGGPFCVGENVIPANAREFTIELWGLYKQHKSWSYMLKIAENSSDTIKTDNLMVAWSVRHIGEAIEVLNASNVGPMQSGGYRGWHEWMQVGWDQNEYHCALVVSRKGDNENIITFYKQSAVSGEVLYKHSFTYCKEWSVAEIKQPNLWVDGPANYNEVRIWNRALSEEELTQNAIKFHKAGETMKK